MMKLWSHFDVVSLFTTIPVNKACEYIRSKLNNDNTLRSRTSLSTDDIISLLDFTLSNNYFVYNNCIYKQIHGCAMGSPVSPIVANLCMEVIEDLAISTSSVPPRVWKRYVDDSFVIIKKDAVSSFHDTLNASGYPKISFTIELENNGQISLLRHLGFQKKLMELPSLIYFGSQPILTVIWISLPIMQKNRQNQHGLDPPVPGIQPP